MGRSLYRIIHRERASSVHLQCLLLYQHAVCTKNSHDKVAQCVICITDRISNISTIRPS